MSSLVRMRQFERASERASAKVHATRAKNYYLLVRFLLTVTLKHTIIKTDLRGHPMKFDGIYFAFL